jgi:hypothetical protein
MKRDVLYKTDTDSLCQLSEQDLKTFCKTLNQKHFTTGEYQQNFEDLAEDYGFNKHKFGIDITDGSVISIKNKRPNVFFYSQKSVFDFKVSDNQKTKWKAKWILPRSDKA